MCGCVCEHSFTFCFPAVSCIVRQTRRPPSLSPWFSVSLNQTEVESHGKTDSPAPLLLSPALYVSPQSSSVSLSLYLTLPSFSPPFPLLFPSLNPLPLSVPLIVISRESWFIADLFLSNGCEAPVAHDITNVFDMVFMREGVGVG